MPFVSQALLEAAIVGLKGKHPLAVITLPAMVKAGVDVVANADDGTPFGAAHEVAVLEAHFKVPGGPAARPYRAVFETKPNFYWRDALYPGKSLQRQRKGRVSDGSAFFQKKVAGQQPDLWGIRATAGAGILPDQHGGSLRLVDLAIWYGREVEVEDLDALRQWFLAEFPLDKGDLVGTLYSDEVPPTYYELPLSPEPLTQPELAESLGAAAQVAPVTDTMADLVTALEADLVAGGFVLPAQLVARVLGAWLGGDVVVLVGQGGSGKTTFANLLSKALVDRLDSATVTTVPVAPEFEESKFIGYERLDQSIDLGPFASEVLLSDQPLGTHIVVFEEFNLSIVEQYMSALLIALQHPDRLITLPGGDAAEVPIDLFAVATCNSPLDEPETRHYLSAPSKRRFTILTMPNVLYERWREDPDSVVGIATQRVVAELGRVADRAAAGLGTGFDTLRQARLATIETNDSWSPAFRQRLTNLVTAVFNTPAGKDYLTMGLLRDMAVQVALADRNEEAEVAALGQVFESKLLHQVRGSKAGLTAILEALGNVPNTASIEALADRMKSVPGEDLAPLL